MLFSTPCLLTHSFICFEFKFIRRFGSPLRWKIHLEIFHRESKNCVQNELSFIKFSFLNIFSFWQKNTKKRKKRWIIRLRCGLSFSIKLECYHNLFIIHTNVSHAYIEIFPCNYRKAVQQYYFEWFMLFAFNAIWNWMCRLHVPNMHLISFAMDSKDTGVK